MVLLYAVLESNTKKLGILFSPSLLLDKSLSFKTIIFKSMQPRPTPLLGGTWDTTPGIMYYTW